MLITLTNVTLFQNSGDVSAGGIMWSGFGITPTVRNTIIANNPAGNCNMAIGGAFNLSTDGSCGFGGGRDNVPDTQPLPLGNYGGFAPTHLPLAASPAVDSASGLYCPATDERGVIRPQGASCDVGAVELKPGEVWRFLFLPLIRR